MANYENGASTRQMIVQACKQLFYEKGFHETSYSDICEAAHVNRGTVYYHFPTKEAMRLEVQWEFLIGNKRVVEQYCPDTRYQYIVAMGLFWKQVQKDKNLRRFSMQCCMDFPVYTGKKDLTHFYFTSYESMWGAFWDKKNISQLSFSSVYGYIMSCMRMLCEHPERYDAMELFEHYVRSSVSIWGVPDELMDQIWTEVEGYLARIPEEEYLAVYSKKSL